MSPDASAIVVEQLRAEVRRLERKVERLEHELDVTRQERDVTIGRLKFHQEREHRT